MSNSTSSNRKVVPAAADALNKFKYEVASDMGVKNLFKNLLILLATFCFCSSSYKEIY